MRIFYLTLFGASLVCAQERALQPRVREMVDAVSAERIEATIQKLASFPTRNTLSSEGNAAARQWIFDQMKSYSPRLEVSLEHFRLKKNEERVFRDADLYNVIAVLPGTSMPGTQVLITGHYDTLNLVPLADQPKDDSGDNLAERTVKYDWTKADAAAPGANDDGSGTAAVMELARVLSQYRFAKTLVFIAFAGEEQGMLGSSLHAAQARKENVEIEAVLNNDIIGGEVAGNGRVGNSVVNVYSDEAMDSVSQGLARYARRMGERYLPSMKVANVLMQDRLGRGGDHTPFQWEGYAAVRFSTPNENYEHEHSASDLPAFMSAPYTARVARINAAVAASLALAPKAQSNASQASSRHETPPTSIAHPACGLRSRLECLDVGMCLSENMMTPAIAMSISTISKMFQIAKRMASNSSFVGNRIIIRCDTGAAGAGEFLERPASGFRPAEYFGPTLRQPPIALRAVLRALSA